MKSAYRLLALGIVACGPALGQSNWPSWRGPLATGVAPDADPPVAWSETSNIKWKVPVPGRGSSSAVVWGGSVFVLTAIPVGEPKRSEAPAAPTQTQSQSQPGTGSVPVAGATASGGAGATERGEPGRQGGGQSGRAQVEQPSQEQRFDVLAYDRETGKIRWQQTATVVLPHEGHHKDHGYASSSPVTDGEVLIAYFGSRGLFAYSLDGRLLWKKELGRQTTRNSFGEGSSPVLHKDLVLVVWDHEGDDFIAAFDKRSGKELWRRPRQESTNWTTPLVVEHAGRTLAVVNSGNKVRSYDVSSGEVVWEAGGQTQNAIPTPVSGNGRVYVTSGWRGAAMQAIQLGRTGDLTGTDAIAWSHSRNTPYVPSPLLYGDLLYFYSNNNAQLTILDTRDGKAVVDAERLEGIFGVYASPVGAANRVYLTGRNGSIWVVKHGPSLEVLAKNKLEDAFEATPAIVGRELFLRGRQNLYAIVEGKH